MKIRSVVERRLLVSYRLDPDVARRLVPSPLELSLVNGWAVGGICLIRLGRVRPVGTPGFVGMRTENAAHRISVELEGRPGVYIPRRDSGSMLSVAASGWAFPGELFRARFDVMESDRELDVEVASDDGSTYVHARATIGDTLDNSRLFASTGEASEFYRRAAVAYSETKSGCLLEGVEMVPDTWRADPIAALDIVSSFFDDSGRFPDSSAVLDSALVMRNVGAAWAPRASLRVA